VGEIYANEGLMPENVEFRRKRENEHLFSEMLTVLFRRLHRKEKQRLGYRIY
jgi:hypothetical protein